MKKSLIFALALMLVLAFASSAMAAQVLQDGSYLSTTATGVYPAGTDATAPLTGFARVYGPNKFTADGISNYPYEIYLPNEKSPASYRIHSSYAKSTDACASCHATHTAVGASLLQWYTIYETCIACHDGTISTTYNVVDGKIGTGKAAFGGMFGTGKEASLSNHNVSGALQIAAAPGGSVVENLVEVGKHVADVDKGKQWSAEFGCESCHTPHGQGGNARILHPDANFAASARAAKNGWSKLVDDGTGTHSFRSDATNPIAFTAYGIDTNTNTTTAGKAYFAAAPTGDNAQVLNVGSGFVFLTGYPYSINIKVYGTEIKEKTKAFSYDNVNGYTRIFIADTTIDATYLNSASKLSIAGIPSMKVTMKIDKYLDGSATGESVTHVDGMNGFCGTCHTDYNTMTAENYKDPSLTGTKSFTGSGKVETGAYSKAHRHQVGNIWYSTTPGLVFEKPNAWSQRLECLSCHVAHGTSQDFWSRTLVTPAVKGPDGSAWTAGQNNVNITELSGSSALKRMPNMGTCEACHAMEIGNQGYAANSGQTPNPLDATIDPDQKDSLAIGNQFFIGAAMTTPDTYVGSSVCAECHADVYDKWLETYQYTLESATAAGLVTSGPKSVIGTSVDHGHASTNTFKPNKGKPGANGPSCDHANDSTGNWGVTEYSCHGIGNNVAFGNLSASSAAYAAVPASFRYSPKNAGTTAGIDAGITCEVCHGSGSRHVKAPSTKNIFNPGTKAYGNLDLFQSQTLACLKCHGVINGTEGSAVPNTVFNMNVTPAQIVAAGKVPLGVHASSAQNYTDSKHYTLGIATCITCHDPHTAKAEPETKLPYEQLCISCHDNAGTLMQTMGTAGATHSFKFGMAGQTGPIASAEFVIQRPKTYINFGLNTSGLWNTLTGTGITDNVTADVKVTGASVRVKDAGGNYIVTNQDKITGFVATLDSHGVATYAVAGKISNLRLNGTLVTDVGSSVYGHVYIEPTLQQQIIFDKLVPAAAADYVGTYSADWTADYNSSIKITNKPFYTVYDPSNLGPLY